MLQQPTDPMLSVFIVRCLVVENLLIQLFDCEYGCLYWLCMLLCSSVFNLPEVQESEMQRKTKRQS